MSRFCVSQLLDCPSVSGWSCWQRPSSLACKREAPLGSQKGTGIVGDSQVEVLRRVVRLQAAVPVHTILQTGHDHLSKVLLEPLEILPNDQKRFTFNDVNDYVSLFYVKIRFVVLVVGCSTHAVGGVGRL